MKVEWDKFFTARDHTRCALHLRHQVDEFRLHLQDGRRAEARHFRDVADKLDGIAEALLAMQQDRTAVKTARRSAVAT